MTKKKRTKPSTSKHSKFILWIMEKRIYFFSILASVVFINIILYKVKPFFEKNTPEMSVLAKSSYEEWEKSAFKDDKKLDDLQTILKKNPGLKPKYEGLILQNLIVQEEFLDLKGALVDKTLDRTKDELPFYYEYSKVAILIHQKEYIKALEGSKELKSKMLQDLSFLEKESLPAGSILYSFNLLRIAFLEAKLKNDQAELLAWQELESYLKIGNEDKLNENIKVASKALKNIFNDNNIELKDYIMFRKHRLSST
ncbi:MAG: hypothetical protein K940chlam1_00859 [Candidatus Anoxychlamydiales bacterium]|nr:hypothetical protein [Candidatus Anoxychlamydiales bacterium]NGX36441.1 hypothetical protein [Candidatus Anoxychlamydiales bacterium]